MQYGDVLQGWKVEELEGNVEEYEELKDTIVDNSRFIESGGGVAVNIAKDMHLIKDETLPKDKESRLKAIFFRSSKFNMNLFQHFIAENQSVSLINFEKDLLGSNYEASKEKLKLLSFGDADDNDTLAMRMCRNEINEGRNFLNIVKFTGKDYSEDCGKCIKVSTYIISFTWLKHFEILSETFQRCRYKSQKIVQKSTGKKFHDNFINWKRKRRKF